ncbi:MAG: conserved phage C-terminal domain-containing protein, partial [Anaerovoracaceae bacterium]
RELIKARLSDGFSVEDFKLVIEKKYKEWQGTEFEKFLRPETLFGTKFESYLNQRSKEDVDAGRSKGAKDEGRRDKKDYSTNGRGFKTL